jgi:hypothetical protein
MNIFIILFFYLLTNINSIYTILLTVFKLYYEKATIINTINKYLI